MELTQQESVVPALRLEEHVLGDNIGSEGNDSNAKTGEHFAKHVALLEDRVLPPCIRFRPWVAVERGRRRWVCHLLTVF